MEATPILFIKKNLLQEILVETIPTQPIQPQVPYQEDWKICKSKQKERKSIMNQLISNF